MKKNRKTSGIIIIGNEVLSGKTLDTNSNFMCKELFKIGISCEEINTIKDEKIEIVKRINDFRSKYDYVFTSGGIGPTHDDITSSCIAEAFCKKLVLNDEAKKRIAKHYYDDILTKARLKMAYIPESATLIDNPVSVAPGFFIQNVFVFPGVPEILQIMFKDFISSLDHGDRYFKKTISTILSEGIIGDYISKIQNKFLNIEIGSYPYFKKNSFGVSLVIKGEVESEVNVVCNEIFEYIKKKKGKPQIF